MDTMEAGGFPLEDDDPAPVAIQVDALAVLQLQCCLVDAHHGGNTVLAGNDRSVGHHAAHFHDQPAGCWAPSACRRSPPSGNRCTWMQPR